MSQTAKSFEDKWSKNKAAFLDVTIKEGSEIFNWILNRNGFNKTEEFKDFLKDKKRILDAGCGNGRVTRLFQLYTSDTNAEIVGIDLTASEVARDNMSTLKNVSVFKRDLLDDLSDLGKFNFIYCQEVLHHVKKPFNAFQNLCKSLTSCGEIAIYVYKKKAPIREHADEFIRNRISSLSYDDAIKTCNQITELGKQLSKCNATINIPKIDILEIPEGEYSIQRFVYHFFLKCFWNNEITFDENALINYDWYHPQIATKHTIEEARSWFDKAGLKIVHECVDFYGITIRGVLKTKAD